jgi:hypothetical protein
MAADGVNYKDAVVVATVKGGQLEIPFPIYACEAVYQGNRVSLDDPKLEGKQVVANVHYMVDHPIEKRNDETKAKAFAGYVTDFHTDARIKTNWTEQVKAGEMKAFCVSAAQLDTDNIAIIKQCQPELAIAIGISEPIEEPIDDEGVPLETGLG